MWLIFVFLYLIFTVTFTQFYKIATKTLQNYAALTVLLQLIAGASVLVLCPFFTFQFPHDGKVYLLLAVAIIFYSVSDRMNTIVRSGIEASTYNIIQQISTVFMIIAGLLFFKEPLVLNKMIGAGLIVASNIFIFYQRGSNHVNKYVSLAIISNLIFSVALFLDVNLSDFFNLPFYVSLTLLGPALLIIIVERVGPQKIKDEFIHGNKKAILITGFAWGLMLVAQLRAYQLGEVTSVAPLCALTVLFNVIIGYVFLKEKSNLTKKIIAAILILISVLFIKL